MGWGLKIALFLFAIVAVPFGAWIITVPVLAFLFLPLLIPKKKAVRNQGSTAGPIERRHGLPLTEIAGAPLLMMSVFAYLSGGVFSPIIPAFAGFALLFGRHLPIRISAKLRPVKNSILLHWTLAPFRWSAVAEAKVSTRDLEGALSGVNERILFASDPKPRLFLIFTANSFSRARAEEVLAARIQSSARALVPLGVYLLPADSSEAASVVAMRALSIPHSAGNVHQSISTTDYGTAVVEAQHGFVTRFELYARPDQASKTTSVLSTLKTRDTGQLTLREFLHETREKLGAPQPDRYTAFLSSMAATEGEDFGQRITQTVEAGNQQTVLVSSLGNPSVELSRAQLRAIAAVYG